MKGEAPIRSLVRLDDEAPEATQPRLDKKTRRRRALQARVFGPRLRVEPVTLAQVPLGSVLSDATIALIEQGKVGLQTVNPQTARGDARKMLRRQALAERRPIRGTNPHPFKGVKNAL